MGHLTTKDCFSPGLHRFGPAVLTALVVFVGLTGWSCAFSRTKTSPAPNETRVSGQTKPVYRVIDGPGDPEQGRDLYLRYCARCHGSDATGEGPRTADMSPPPRDLTTGRYKYKSAGPGYPPTAGDLFRTIAQGVPGSAMPAWGDALEEAQIWNLVAYLRTLSNRFDNSIPESELVTYPPEPAASPESVQSGKKLFEQMACDSCHGKTGRGNGPDAPGLTDHKDRPITPQNFLENLYGSGGTSRDLYRTIRNGIGGTPMPAYGKVAEPYGPTLESEQIWHLVHYVESLREPKTLGEYLFGDEVGRELLYDYR